jgi:hypothetical protein
MTHHPHNHLEQWLADEAAVKQRMDAGPGPGLATTEQIAGKTGLEVMQGLLRGELPYRARSPRTLDFTMVHVEKGHAVFQGHAGNWRTSTRWARCMAAGSPRCSTRRWAARCTP